MRAVVCRIWRTVYVTRLLIRLSPHLLSGLLTYPIQIDSISVSPDPPKLGENLTVTVKAHAQERVEVCIRIQFFVSFAYRWRSPSGRSVH
jgi:hypothetical protein